MKKSTEMRLKAGIMSFALTLGALGFGSLATSCKQPTGTEQEQQKEDLIITYKNVKIVIGANLKNNFPQSEINKLQTDLQAIRDYIYYKSYLESKSEFTIYVQPLTNPDFPSGEFRVVNDREVIVSDQMTNAHMVSGAIESAIGHAMYLYPLAQIKHFNNAITPRAQIATQRCQSLKLSSVDIKHTPDIA